MKRPSIRVEAFAFSHATEDEELITSSMLGVIGQLSIKVEDLQGQYSQVKKISGTAEGEEAEALALKVIRAAMGGAGAIDEVLRGVDKNRLYIRLDKQDMVRGLLSINGDNQVKLVITAKNNRELMDLIRRAAEEV